MLTTITYTVARAIADAFEQAIDVADDVIHFHRHQPANGRVRFDIEGRGDAMQVRSKLHDIRIRAAGEDRPDDETTVVSYAVPRWHRISPATRNVLLRKVQQRLDEDDRIVEYVIRAEDDGRDVITAHVRTVDLGGFGKGLESAVTQTAFHMGIK